MVSNVSAIHTPCTSAAVVLKVRSDLYPHAPVIFDGLLRSGTDTCGEVKVERNQDTCEVNTSGEYRIICPRQVRLASSCATAQQTARGSVTTTQQKRNESCRQRPAQGPQGKQMSLGNCVGREKLEISTFEWSKRFFRICGNL